jgi:hypothetical protein
VDSVSSHHKGEKKRNTKSNAATKTSFWEGCIVVGSFKFSRTPLNLDYRGPTPTLRRSNLQAWVSVWTTVSSLHAGFWVQAQKSWLISLLGKVVLGNFLLVLPLSLSVIPLMVHCYLSLGKVIYHQALRQWLEPRGCSTEVLAVINNILWQNMYRYISKITSIHISFYTTAWNMIHRLIVLLYGRRCVLGFSDALLQTCFREVQNPRNS